MICKYDDENRTHRRLRKAYTFLISQKSYKEISVKELVDYAEMSRAAFYLHFDSIEDFSFQCSQYLIKKITSQMFRWLDGGKDNAEKNCKKRNLLLDETDRELFCQYVRQEIYFTGYSSMDTIAPMYYDFLQRRFGLTVEECIADMNLCFFIRAFSATIMETLMNYDSKKAARELQYVFMIWDKLLPQYKL